MEFSAILIGLTRSIALVALVALVFGWTIRVTNRPATRGSAVGLLLGAGGVLSMADPLQFAPGIIFDGRTMLLAVSFPFGGFVGTIVAGLVMATYRMWLGGIGAFPGVVGITCAGLISIAFGHIPRRRFAFGPYRSAVLGALVTLSILPSLFMLPELAAAIVQQMLLPVLIANVIGVVIVTEFLGREKERLRMVRTLEHAAGVDPLTKLPNRRAFDRAAAAAEAGAAGHGGGFSVVMIDIDHFKSINDTHGHSAGDKVLVDVADIVRGSLRSTDVVARYGGEEIVILLPLTDLHGASMVADTIRRRIDAQEFDTGTGRIHVTISAGAASVGNGRRDMDAVVKAADMALYRAKNAGRNRVEREERLAA